MESLGFIGVGNIAAAILKGVLKSGYITSDSIHIFDPDQSKTAPFVTGYGVHVADRAEDVVQSADCIVIAVKPAVVESVLNTIAPVVCGQCIVSVAAGISLSFIGAHLPAHTPVIRAMPNTPLMYGNGAVAFAVNSAVSPGRAAFVKGMFSACGYATQVEEALLDSVTAVSGSSPAFVFRFIRDMIAQGEAQGLPEPMAADLIIQTVIGSAVMLRESGESADALIRMVASPNGTTEAGLAALDRTGFDTAVQSAIDAAYRRSIELTK